MSNDDSIKRAKANKLLIKMMPKQDSSNIFFEQVVAISIEKGLKFNKINLSNFNNYLIYKGWICDGDIGDLATVWHRNEEKFFNQEIVLPKKKGVKDYCKRINDVFDVLCEFENRELNYILSEINDFQPFD